MAKEKSIYACTECGGTSPKWQGKCPSCGAWNTLVEAVDEGAVKNRFATPSRGLTPGEAVAKRGLAAPSSTASTSVFQAPQLGHLPCHFGLLPPHSVHA